MMKKIKIGAILIGTIILLSMLYNFYKSSELKLKKNDGSLLELSELTSIKDKELIFIHFSIGCGECYDELKRVSENTELNKKYHIYYVCNNPKFTEINNYLKENNLKIDADNLLTNENKSFEKFFNIGFETIYPSIYRFNAINKTKTQISFFEL